MADPKELHTFVVSDMHLCEAEPTHPHNPLWKRFKRKKLFIDRPFRRLVNHWIETIEGPKEIIFNGDIFDFDSVMEIPKKPEYRVSWIEKRRGLFATEPKSLFKIGVILRDHEVWVNTLREYLMANPEHKAIFVIGNHDMELHWPTVQKAIVDAFRLPEELQENVVFADWFYISGKDTLIEHGNQYDAYCLCSNPIHPMIKKGFKTYVRLPFGNLAGRFMTNGMGLFNPHVESSYIKSSFGEYMVFFAKYIIRVQPFLIFTWFWGACATLFYSIGEGLLPAIKDPLTLDSRIQEIANRANTTPKVVRSLSTLHVHPAIFSPLKILKELWLDRALFLLGIFLISFWIFSTLNVFANFSIWWFLVPLAGFLSLFVFYAQSVESEVYKVQLKAMQMVHTATEIAKVKRAVHGHTHRETHIDVGDVEVINTGTWSAAYEDVECTKPKGRKCFAWVHPNEGSSKRSAELYVWNDPGVEVLPKNPDFKLPS